VDKTNAPQAQHASQLNVYEMNALACESGFLGFVGVGLVENWRMTQQQKQPLLVAPKRKSRAQRLLPQKHYKGVCVQLQQCDAQN
jgi:hypothetical protein